MQSMRPASPDAAAAPAPQPALTPDPIADSPTATQAAEAPELGAPQLVVPAANIKVVRTAGELQRAALAGAQDIEIRAHLDLRSLELAPNPALSAAGTTINRNSTALLYATPPLRSIRGNCSGADAEAALGLPPGTLPDLLPLKPRQCLLVMEQSWLMVNSGNIWMDNLYLKLSRTRVQPSFTFITAGSLNAPLTAVLWPDIGRSDIYVTDTTFHGEHRGNARGIVSDFTGIAVYVRGCIFTDWAGFESPITLNFQSMASIRDSVFRNMHLHVEIVDISFSGTVNFQNVSLANVRLEHGSIVSTTLNDYQDADFLFSRRFNACSMYYADQRNYHAGDDGCYDVRVDLVPDVQRSMFGEQFVVINSTTSDCVYLLQAPHAPVDVLVGLGCNCKAAEDLVGDYAYGDYEYIHRPAAAHAPGQGSDDMLQPARSDYAPYVPRDYSHYDGASAPESDFMSWCGIIDDDGVAVARLQLQFVTRDDHIWLEQTRQVLLRHEPAPGWPPSLLPMPPPPDRASLRPERVTPTPATAAAIVGLLSDQPHPARPASGRHGVNPLAILLIGAASAAMLATALFVCTRSKLLRWSAQRCPMATNRKHQQERHRRNNHNATSPKLMLRATENRESTGAHAVPERSGSGARPRGRPHNAGRVFPSRRGGNYSASIVSNGVDVPPSSLLNPDYEYELPLHLALFAQPPTSSTSPGDIELGSAVVFAPNTVKFAQPADASRTTHTSPDKAEQSRDVGNILSACNGVPASVVIHQATGVGEHSHLFERQSRSHRSLDLIMRNDGKAAAASEEAQQSARGLTLVADAAADGEEDLQGSRHVGLAQAASCDATQQTTAVPRRLGLERQLNRFTASDLFLGRFEMLGRHHRRRGGQAVVQFAKARPGRGKFAIKFFLDWDAFITEAALYAAAFPDVRRTVSPEIAARADAPTTSGADAAVPMSVAAARFLPKIEVVCDGTAGELQDPGGRPLPPCIVMEVGESLHDLYECGDVNIFTICSVLSNVSRRVADMHAAGFVHRDLKPANVMWLPRQNRWTVIDFGCVARVGEQAPLSFSLAYAAPEVAVAYLARQRSIQAQPALDAWSLGVTAFELLTGASAFDLVTFGRSAVLAMLEGAKPLPWEGELSLGLRSKLGLLRGPVLQLLQREPARRSTLEAFYASCDRILEHTTSTSQT